MKKVFFFLIPLSVLLAACDPAVAFSEPQPSGSDDLKEIPHQLLGKYISKKTIVLSGAFETVVKKSWLDSALKDKSISEPLILGMRGDSVLIRTTLMDTLFCLSPNQIMRSFKGAYFLSKRFDNNKWEVEKIDLKAGKLTINRIDPEQAAEKLKNIIHDTISDAPVKLSRRQFRRFVKSGGFKQAEEFVRIFEN
jgi:hypothetical protein